MTHLFTPPCTPDKVDIRKGPIRGTLDPPAIPSLLASQILTETTYALLIQYLLVVYIKILQYMSCFFFLYALNVLTDKKNSKVYQLKSLSTYCMI